MIKSTNILLCIFIRSFSTLLVEDLSEETIARGSSGPILQYIIVAMYWMAAIRSTIIIEHFDSAVSCCLSFSALA
jgi:sporulation protein YlmC with PRC-barrel domain